MESIIIIIAEKLPHYQLNNAILYVHVCIALLSHSTGDSVYP